MRLALRPGAVLTWRRVDALHVSVDHTDVLLTGLPIGTTTLLRLLDGAHTLGEVLTSVAESSGLSADVILDLIDRLRLSGAVYDFDQLPDLGQVAEPHRRRLQAEAIAWSATSSDAVARRQRAIIRVRGTHVVGVMAARLLATAGVGAVLVESATSESAIVEQADVLPGAFAASQLGTPRVGATRALLQADGARVRAIAHETITAELIFAANGEPARLGGETPHLVVAASGVAAQVGPFVVPGITACAACADLRRRDSLQLAGGSDAVAGTTQGRDGANQAVAAVALGAAYAATAVLEFVDGAATGTLPSLAGHVLTMRLPGPQVQLDPIRPHPQCGCCWDAA